MTDADLDEITARVFATPDGKAWLDAMRNRSPAMFTVVAIEAAIARMRRRWATGAPSAAEDYRQERRAWAQEIGWPWP